MPGNTTRGLIDKKLKPASLLVWWHGRSGHPRSPRDGSIRDGFELNQPIDAREIQELVAKIERNSARFQILRPKECHHPVLEQWENDLGRRRGIGAVQEK